MKKYVITITLLAALVFAYAPKTQAFSAKNIVRLDNQVRTVPLTLDERLSNIAQKRAIDMATKHYFSHVSPEGYRAWYFMQQDHYSYYHAGENLALGFQNDQSAFDAWMNSPGHKANILDPNFTKTGIGFAQVDGQTLIVQLFAQPYDNGPR